jgi:uracil-DNA glycosylase
MSPKELPPSWRAVLADQFKQPYFHQLQEFLAEERKEHEVYPPEEDVFSAFKCSPFEKTNVLLLGQDPYHDKGQAHGLCFSVRPGVKPPPSLRNMLKELHDDLGCRTPNNGYLEPWAVQGILMLNTVLTVRAGAIGSHRGKGWETFTDTVIEKVNAKKDAVVFLLWGRDAQSKADRIDEQRHVVLRAAHPSPLSARHGFFGTRPFSATNRALRDAGRPEIDWQIPDL